MSATAGERYETPAYANTLGSGDRVAAMTGHVSTSGATMWGNIQSNPYMLWHFDGDTSNAGGYTNDGIAVANEWYEWDLVTKHLITEIKFYFSAAAATCGVWRIQGYNGSWVNIGNTFTLGTGLTQTVDLSANATGYTKYRMLGVSGNSSFNLYYWAEIEFKIGALL